MIIREDIKNNMLEVNVGELEVLSYQVGMVNNNRDLNVIEMNKVVINGQNTLSFDLKQRVSLKKYFEKDELEKEEVLKIMIKIARIIIECSDYLLSEKNFILDPRYIYYEYNEVYLIYVPVSEDINRDVDEEFRKLVKYIIVDLVRFSRMYENDGFIGILLSLAKQEDLDIKIFKDRISELLNSDVRGKEKENSIFSEYPNLKSEIIRGASITQTNKSKNHYRNNVDLDIVDSDEIESSKKNTYPLWLRVGIGALQVFAIGLILVLMVAGIDTRSLLLVSFIVILIDIFIVRFLLQPKDDVEEVCITDEEEEIRLEKIQQDEDEKGFINIGKKEIVSQNAYQTSMLEKSAPYFLLVNEGITERVYITKENFVIGRRGGECDYVINNNTVGKRHMRITKVNKAVYVEDMHSKNGSYINGKKLEPGKVYKVEENFKIKISNVSLTFKEV